MMDDIFWNMGFKNADAVEKVVMSSLLLFWLFLQVWCALDIAQQDWQERRKNIADTIESLGDEYRTALHDGWLAYIQEIYASPTTTQQGALKCNLDAIFVDN